MTSIAPRNLDVNTNNHNSKTARTHETLSHSTTQYLRGYASEEDSIAQEDSERDSEGDAKGGYSTARSVSGSEDYAGLLEMLDRRGATERDETSVETEEEDDWQEEDRAEGSGTKLNWGYSMRDHNFTEGEASSAISSVEEDEEEEERTEVDVGDGGDSEMTSRDTPRNGDILVFDEGIGIFRRLKKYEKVTIS